MHRFVEYISDLLYLHDCVIIPRFGGFICNYKSAYIDETSGLICPPTKEILFNRNLTHNDGLLVNWIANKENISFEKATSQLLLFSEELKIKLNQRQQVVFGEIGVFSTDRRFNIIFEAGKQNFYAGTFGMEPLKIAPLPSGKTRFPAFKPEHASTDSAIPAYIPLESSGNFLHRLLKYALGATAVVGMAIITQMDLFHTDTDPLREINNTAIHPRIANRAARTSNTVVYQNVISPACDYVTYDPLEDLKE